MEVFVYHLTDSEDEESRKVLRNIRFGDLEPVGPVFEKGGYHKVATVVTKDLADEIDALEIAFERTNHIDSSWTENSDVIAESGRHRSTSVGDIAVVNGKVYVARSMGWEVTAFTPPMS